MGSFKTSSSLIICFPWSGLQPSNPLSRWKDFTDCVSSMDIPMFSGPSNNSCTQSLDLRTRRRKNKSDEITVMECRIPRAMWSNCNSLEHHTFFDKYRYPPPEKNHKEHGWESSEKSRNLSTNWTKVKGLPIWLWNLEHCPWRLI